jgi:hypothetical protein
VERGPPSLVRPEEDEGVRGGLMVTLLSDLNSPEVGKFLRTEMAGEIRDDRRATSWFSARATVYREMALRAPDRLVATCGVKVSDRSRSRSHLFAEDVREA